MNRFYILFTLLLVSIQLLSQDLDIYQKNKNDNYLLPKINQEMSFDEFHLLSQNIRMKDMLYGIIVPGHVHFKAQSRKMGFWLLGIRSASYIAIGGVYIYADNKYPELTLSEVGDDEDVPLKTILYTSALTAIGTYIFDLIHGEGVLKRKQEKIRYKYALKLRSDTMSFMSQPQFPQLGLVFTF